MRRLTTGMSIVCFSLVATGCVNIIFNNHAATGVKVHPVLPDQHELANAPPGYSSHDPRFQFNGTWIGTLQGYAAPQFMDGKGYPYTFCIFISADKHASLFKWTDNQWHAFGNDRPFYETSWGPQAVVQSLGSGRDKDGTWVEGLQFKFVRHDADTAIVYWLRTVNNLDMPSTAKWHNFAWGYSGPMRRIATGGEPACKANPPAKQ